MENIREKFDKIILNTLELDNFIIKGEMVASEVPGWDSLSHLNVLSALETGFSVELKSSEIKQCKNINQLFELVKSKSITF